MFTKSIFKSMLLVLLVIMFVYADTDLGDFGYVGVNADWTLLNAEVGVSFLGSNVGLLTLYAPIGIDFKHNQGFIGLGANVSFLRLWGAFSQKTGGIFGLGLSRDIGFPVKWGENNFGVFSVGLNLNAIAYGKDKPSYTVGLKIGLYSLFN